MGCVESVRDGVRNVPGEDGRNGVSDLSLGLSQSRLEDEIVREGLDSGCLSHGDSSRKLVVVLNVPVALSPDCVSRTMRV